MKEGAARRKVLLVGWDSADWKIIQPLLDRGEMPVLERVINGGVMADLASVRPMLSPMLWNSIATGKRPFKHGVSGFTEVDYELNTVVPVSTASRKCKALWNILNEAGLRTHVIGWFATHPAEAIDGVCVTDRFAASPPPPGQPWPVPAGSVHPENLTETLADLRVRPEEMPGDLLKLFVPEATKVDQQHDKRLHQLALHLSEAFSIHAAATYALEHESWDFAAIYYRAIDWICHHFMEFHPPRRPGIYDAEFELYRDVVNGAYRLHDLMLGRLLELSGNEATVIVVSDHGFRSGDDRPKSTPNVPLGIAAWHRTKGILAMRGKGLRADELIHGASILDITPTILTAFGLPIGSDMDGRPLVEGFSEAPQIQRIESWEKTAVQRPRSANSNLSGDDARELVRQLADIGYVEFPEDNPDMAIRWTERENTWAIAQSYLEASRPEDALPLLESVFEEWPERRDYCIELALCQLNLGLLDEAEETISSLPDSKRRAGGRIFRANIELRRKNFDAAAALLEQAETSDPPHSGLQNQIGLARLRLRQWKLAEAAFRKAAALDPDNAYAHVGLANSLLRAGQNEAAAECALHALALRFDLPLAHYNLGLALARLGEFDRATQAFQTCLRYQPGWPRPHRYLAFLFARRGDGERAVLHRQHSRAGKERSAAAAAYHARMRSEALARAQQRSAGRARLRAQSVVGDSSIKSSSEPLEFLIVSGLPRSGTSLMMQMLDAAGMPIMRDDSRAADESNPRGYFEWQEIKQLPKNPYLIEKTQGRVTKVISMLLPSLPRKHRFRVIFMNRDIEEVAASQQKLRQRLSPTSVAERIDMTKRLQEHRDRMLDLLRSSANVSLLEIDYVQLLESPNELLPQIIEFAGLNASAFDRMRAVIDPDCAIFTQSAHRCPARTSSLG